ncbi:hypothetical protein AB1N83_013840 [Pleurotus pulmonarius]
MALHTPTYIHIELGLTLDTTTTTKCQTKSRTKYQMYAVGFTLLPPNRAHPLSLTLSSLRTSRGLRVQDTRGDIGVGGGLPELV